MKKNFLLFICLLALTMILTPIVLAEGETMVNSDLVGYYNLDEYQNLTNSKINKYNQAPEFNEKVSSGQLPPVEDRLPENPLIVIPQEEIGKYGGVLTWDGLLSDSAEILRYMSGRLVNRPPSARYFQKSGLAGPTQPGIISDWKMSEDGKTFTLTIRKGLKWSDGVPVTTDDVEYCINDVLKNKEINPVAEQWLRWGGIETKLNIVNDSTFQLIFGKPYGAFIEKEVRTSQGLSYWAKFMRPKHFLKRYHKKYTSWDDLIPLMQERGYEEKEEWGTFYNDIQMATWAAQDLFIRPYALEVPTLDPYILATIKANSDLIMKRNPYFYMVDTEGNQLPYIDELHRLYVSKKEMVTMDALQGKVDFASRLISIQDYPLFMKNRDKGGYNVMNLKSVQNQLLMYWFNLAVDNEVFPTEVISDVRFRQALSLALDREHIKESVFLGFGEPAQFTTSKNSPYYEEGMAEAYADYDPEKAEELLDEMGLVDSNGDGWREGPDGKILILPMDYTLTTPVAVPGVELAQRYWEDIGIKVQAKLITGSLFWERNNANKNVLSPWWGDGTTAYIDWWLGFSTPVPMWRNWYNTDGSEGIEPPEWAKKVLKWQEDIVSTTSEDERIELGKKIWGMQRDKLYIIGTVAGSPQPFIYNNKLRNIKMAQELNWDELTTLKQGVQWFFAE